MAIEMETHSIGILITNREVYDAVIRLTGRVDVLIEQQQHASGEIKDHEIRIRELEKARWPLPAASLLVAVLSIGITIVSALIN
jgi:hypothetical protein